MQNLILVPYTRLEFKNLIIECVEEVLKKQDRDSRPDSNKPLSLKEACEFLNLAPQTIYGYTSKNLIPFKKVGKKLYFSKSELIEWLQKGKQKSITEITSEANLYFNKPIH